MKRIRLVGLALVAVFALGAITAISASAAEPTKILPEPTEAKPLTSESTSGEITLLSIGGVEVKCAKATDTSSFTSANLGIFHVLFTECTSAEKTVCTGGEAGEGKGLIGVLGVVHFWLALLMMGTKEKETTELVGALVFLNKTVKFTCESATLKIPAVVKEGCVAAQAKPLNKFVKETEDEFKEWVVSGEQSILEVLPQESSSEIKCLLQVEIAASKKFELAALKGLIKNKNFKRGGVAVEVELMNPEGHK